MLSMILNILRNFTQDVGRTHSMLMPAHIVPFKLITQKVCHEKIFNYSVLKNS